MSDSDVRDLLELHRKNTAKIVKLRLERRMLTARVAELDQRNEKLFYALMNLTDHLAEHDVDGMTEHSPLMTEARIALDMSGPALPNADGGKVVIPATDGWPHPNKSPSSGVALTISSTSKGDE